LRAIVSPESARFGKQQNEEFDMNDPNNSPDHVTIIKERSSGGGVVLGMAVAVILAILAFMVFSGSDKADPSDASIKAAAEKVGAAADKVGDAAQDAAKKVQ
jgi:hypothetical protein